MRKLIIISNRLPFKIKKRGDKYEAKQSSGGLVSAIQSIPNDKRITWIGAADFKKEVWDAFSKEHNDLDYDIVPVFLDKKVESLYYNGFSNTMIWPLFHYFPSYAEYEENFYSAYKTVNQQFADAVKSVANENDLVWIHDYHLMLLPGYLKTGKKQISSSFFLHIPFPSYELIKFIPEDWRNEILGSLLSCDVIGFQTSEYSSHFKRSLSYLMGIECVNNSVTQNGHTALIRDYPISIDFEKFNSAWDLPLVIEGREAIRHKHEGLKIIFSLDRLDYSKGVLNRLQAYEQLLSEEKSLHGKIVFVINVIPSREKVARYAERKKLIEENISRINGLYSNIAWQPIIYHYQHLSFDELLACYTACDVALVTPLRDGMNLVAKEFVASRQDERGCLILSEFAGAVQELQGAIVVNPNDIHKMKEAMVEAIQLDESEQAKRMRIMQATIRRNDVKKWSSTFLEDAKQAKKMEKASVANFMSFDDKIGILDAYRSARKRLILLDYDGTLIPFFDKPQEAVPGDVLKDLVSRLTESKKNHVMLISGRDSATLESWFRNAAIDIVAEHGSKHKARDSDNWECAPEITLDWKESARVVVEKYVNEIPGSFAEEKEYSIAWHYRGVENFDEESVKLALSRELLMLNMQDDFDILHGNKVVEIKSTFTSKGRFINRFLKNKDYDFVLAIGDDLTDEDMFKVLKEKHHYTIKVGMGGTAARYNVIGVNNVLSFLDQMSSYRDPVFR